MRGTGIALALLVCYGLTASGQNDIEASPTEGCQQHTGSEELIRDGASLMQLGVLKQRLDNREEVSSIDSSSPFFPPYNTYDRSSSYWRDMYNPMAAIGFVGLIIIVFFWSRWQEAQMTLKEQAVQGGVSQCAAAGHSTLLDNAKCIAQFLVIYNHLMYYGSLGESQDTKTFMSGADGVMAEINNGFSYLVNPFFCFVSGVVSQGAPNPRRILRYVQYLVIPTLVYHFVVEPVFQQPMKTMNGSLLYHRLQPAVFGQEFVRRMTLCPPWYLFALCLWRGSAYLVWAHLPKPVAFAGMLVVSCAAGYFQLPNNGEHGFSATLAYLPCFGLGFVFPFQDVTVAIPKPRALISFCVVALLGVYMFIMMPYITSFIPLPDGHGWYGCCDAGKSFLAASKVAHSLWWCRRLLKVAADLFAILAMLFLVLPRSEMPITYMGSHTLYSYLFHPLMLSWKNMLLVRFPPPVSTSAVGHALGFIFYIPFALFTLAFFTSSFFRAFFRWALTPAWLDPLSKHCLQKLEGKKLASSNKNTPGAENAQTPQQASIKAPPTLAEKGLQ